MERAHPYELIEFTGMANFRDTILFKIGGLTLFLNMGFSSVTSTEFYVLKTDTWYQGPNLVNARGLNSSVCHCDMIYTFCGI